MLMMFGKKYPLLLFLSQCSWFRNFESWKFLSDLSIFKTFLFHIGSTFLLQYILHIELVVLWIKVTALYHFVYHLTPRFSVMQYFPIWDNVRIEKSLCKTDVVSTFYLRIIMPNLLKVIIFVMILFNDYMKNHIL